MAIYLGNKKLDKLYIGDTPIKEVYQGSNLVWNSSTLPDGEVREMQEQEIL